ncbi:MAG: transketolase [candidate division WS1 bacterium]|jgi:transketolase|nr:transketolase [candidate division WS1 bacterium]
MKRYSVEELSSKAAEMRAWVMTAICAANSGHPGGSLSIMDLVAALYLHHLKHDPAHPDWPDRDRVYWSAGHKAPALYVALGMAGYFDQRPVTLFDQPLPDVDLHGVEQAALLRRLGSGFEGHPNRLRLPGVELSSGSLGQGLGVASGTALALRLEGRDSHVYCIMGDGEQDEGSVWEAVMGAAHHRLDNLIAILDRNFLQIDGNTEEVMRLEPLADKYRAFGWNVLEIDGHDLSAILEAFQAAVDHVGSPTVILATTVKGQGVSYTANACGYHGVPPKDGLCGPESLETAVCDLGVEDVLTPERRARVLAAVAKYQEAVDAYVEARLPRFAHDYWWNHGETMQVEMDATRNGYGRALADLAADPRFAGIASDITESIRMDRFYRPDGKTPDPEREKRFFCLGIAEANATQVAAGLARAGMTPFIGSYGVFITGRNWDQLRTTVAYNELDVKIADAHGGVSVGQDGATHQALEEIALISILPHFTMVVPCDAIETEKATRAIAEIRGPAVVRYAREATPVVTSPATPFVLGQANVTRLRRESESFLEAFDTVLASDYQNEHEDLAIIACGPMVPEAMRAAVILKHEYGLETRIVNVHTVKPLDAAALAAAGREIGVILTAEEHQVGGFGNRVAAALCEADLGRELRFRMIGVRDTFGETGQPWELIKLFGLSAEHLAHTAAEMLGKL